MEVLKNYLIKSKLLRNILRHIPLDLRKVHSITLEVSSACNLSCPFCPVGNKKVEPKLMTLEDHNKIIDLLPKSVKTIRYSYRGEPLLNKDISKMIRYAHDKGFKTDVSSNGMLLINHINGLIDSGLDRLLIAIDGATQETQTKYRIGSNLDNIKFGIRMLAEQRQGRYPKEIVIQTVVSAFNENEITALQQMTKELGADKIKFKSMATRLGSDFKNNKKDSFVPKNPNYKRKGFDNVICPFIWETVILYNGDITLCCSDFLGKYIVGNVIKEDSFEKVVYSKKYNDLRKKILDRKLPMCKNCVITGDYWLHV